MDLYIMSTRGQAISLLSSHNVLSYGDRIFLVDNLYVTRRLHQVFWQLLQNVTEVKN